ncbi:nitrilase [Microvirga tunisiensis]|uniref:Nitrilase n=1 Tax=Pannonibacter tanglangensis TaxID=2750084 RepID=A0A7X5J7Y3_9HYPH|nr:nitrilase-related carbon-nitrogen hydrolase [Pannonibacter sp. XCT-53]NBN78134.1 nitrilase [Pannonibacter sp. XCT-53]
MPEFPIALCSLNLGFAPASPDAYVAAIDQRMARARADGARLLMLPEYAIEACLAFKPAGLLPTEEMAFLAEVAVAIAPDLAALAARHGLSLLAGSGPWPQPGGGHTNRAILFTPDGRRFVHDKLSLTPFERAPEPWVLTPGRKLTVFELEGVRMAMLICLDVEMPALSCLLAREEIDLLLVPSMTGKLSGYHRVYDCAKARAVELLTSVALCGCTGVAEGTTQNDTNVSGAALYIPCEAELGYTGTAASLPPTGGEQGEEPYVVVHPPIDAVRRLRKAGAEVWPGAWSADAVSVERLSG